MRAKLLQAKVIQGDCLDVMAGMPDASIDAIVTDPPYGLSFMGKDWDKGVPGEAFWREALRIAKPGCHILAAGGSRTYHRLAVAIEDAGWEIRDCIMWIYGSGFPKSHDVSKAIDREAGAKREKVLVPTKAGNTQADRGISYASKSFSGFADISASVTEAAKQWQGWGTALKPAFEPFILARKPLDGTVAVNVQRHGCGALNVEGCRVKGDQDYQNAGWGPRFTASSGQRASGDSRPWSDAKVRNKEVVKNSHPSPFSRWPANVIHDGSDEATHLFGSAARFFYCPKASRGERGEQNHHPTVKPVELMAYLCRLITPPDGMILDPFCGSGSTGVAAMREGFNFTGIELNPEYVEIAKRRISHEREKAALLA